MVGGGDGGQTRAQCTRQRHRRDVGFQLMMSSLHSVSPNVNIPAEVLLITSTTLLQEGLSVVVGSPRPGFWAWPNLVLSEHSHTLTPLGSLCIVFFSLSL